ncbi:hypothetical protein X766_33460 [Mesorhizobium sp. LSJC255A00]|nr:hypothetical protein X766_33460 [Mesorhizobium sp. LSJC255A00]
MLADSLDLVGIDRTPIPRLIEPPPPKAAVSRFGSALLGGECSLRIARPVEGQTLFDKPALNAATVCAIAIPYKPAITIAVNKAATQRSRSCQELDQGLGGAEPTGIFEALGVVAILATLRCVDAVEADALKRARSTRKRKAAREAGVIELEIDGVAMRVGRGADARTVAAVIRVLKAPS